MTPVPALDMLVRRRTISGYTVEREADYLWAQRPTLTYRTYQDRSGAVHASRFAADLQGLGAVITMTAATGNLGTGAGILRSPQVTVAATFPERRGIARALALVRRRYHARGERPVTGSWWLPDVRLSACPGLAGTMPVVAQWGRTGSGVAVVLTLTARRLLPGLGMRRVHVLSEWADLLAPGAVA